MNDQHSLKPRWKIALSAAIAAALVALTDVEALGPIIGQLLESIF